MIAQTEIKRYTVEDYLELEIASEPRNEYCNGEIIPTTGGTPEHNEIASILSTEFRVLGEQLAHVDANTDDAVIARPGAQHLPRTASEVEHSVPWFQTQGSTEGSELFGGDRVVDAVSTLSDAEYPWDVHWGKFPYRCE